MNPSSDIELARLRGRSRGAEVGGHWDSIDVALQEYWGWESLAWCIGERARTGSSQLDDLYAWELESLDKNAGTDFKRSIDVLTGDRHQ